METVVIVDDHAGFRQGARQMLEADGFRVVGEAESLAAARLVLGWCSPDLVLLDVVLPDGVGFELAEELAAAASTARIVLISSREAIDYGDRIAGCGARGFIPKHRLTAESLRAYT